MSYCNAIDYMSADRKAIHKNYHDNYYGFPIHNDNELFCRLILEINQAGLSWETILKKEGTFRKAYDNFDLKKVAAYTEDDRTRLMNDPGIIRNRLKINAAIENAKTILKLQKEYGSFEKWLEAHHPKTKEEWVKLFKKIFRFTGGEIVNEFLMSIGYLQGAHSESCPVHKKVMKQKPIWALKKKAGFVDFEKLAKKLVVSANKFDVDAVVLLFADDSIIDDISVGQKFKNGKGVRNYFEKFFVGYNTATKIMSVEIINDRQAKVQVDFSGDFGHETGVLSITVNTNGFIIKMDAHLD